MVERGIVQVYCYDEGNLGRKQYAAAIRAVHRYLSRAGFLRGKKTGPVGLREEHKAKLCTFLRDLLQNRALPVSSRLRKFSQTNTMCTTTTVRTNHHCTIRQTIDVISPNSLAKEEDIVSFVPYKKTTWEAVMV